MGGACSSRVSPPHLEADPSPIASGMPGVETEELKAAPVEVGVPHAGSGRFGSEEVFGAPLPRFVSISGAVMGANLNVKRVTSMDAHHFPAGSDDLSYTSSFKPHILLSTGKSQCLPPVYKVPSIPRNIENEVASLSAGGSKVFPGSTGPSTDNNKVDGYFRGLRSIKTMAGSSSVARRAPKRAKSEEKRQWAPRLNTDVARFRTRSAPVRSLSIVGAQNAPVGYTWCLSREDLVVGSGGQLLETQYLNAQAGEDRCQLVISIHGFVFLAVFDGFSGNEATEFLKENLYEAVYRELEGVLWGKDMTEKKAYPEGETGAHRQPFASADRQGMLDSEADIPCRLAESTPNEAEPSSLDVNHESRSSDNAFDGFCRDGQNGATDGIGEAKQHERVLQGLLRAVASTEKIFFEHVRLTRHDRPELVLVGSCVVVTMVYKDDVYVLNLGDSSAFVGITGRAAGSWKHPDDSLSACSHGVNTSTPRKEASNADLSNFNGLRASSDSGSLHDSAHGAKLGHRSSSRRLVEAGIETLLKQEGLLQDDPVSSESEMKPAPWSYLQPYLLSTSAKQLTAEHNTSSSKEMERLSERLQEDPELVVRERIKGKVKGTRCFGAAYLKMSDLNDELLGIFRVKYIGNAPYLSSVPHLQHHRLGPHDKWLVVASDGLYQRLDPEEVVALLERSNGQEMETDPAEVLLQEALERAAAQAGLTYQELLAVPAGDRRRGFHDDLSILVLKLETR